MQEWQQCLYLLAVEVDDKTEKNTNKLRPEVKELEEQTASE